MANGFFNFSFKTLKSDLDSFRRFYERGNYKILVGFPSGMKHIETIHYVENGKRKTTSKQSDEDTADLARKLSFGTSSIPARPFLDDGLFDGREKLNTAIAKELKKTDPKSWNLDKIGTMAVGCVQEFVRGDTYKNTIPNAPSTIAYKGSDRPLIDGANMVQSVQYVVVRGQNPTLPKGDSDVGVR